MTNVKILVIEDDRTVAADIKSSLEILGFDVPDTASSREEALEKVAKTQPDLVLITI